MPGPYDLSFCIPTYNFGAFLPETLESIVQQADHRVQIVIVDGASTDNTPQVVEHWQARFPHIKYIRRPARVGVDPDILESVRQADGDYCWLFSADDVLEPGAIDRIRAEIQLPWDAWLTNFTLCDLRLNRLEPHKIVAIQKPRTFDWNQPDQRQAFLNLAQTSTAFFSFISGIVVRREAWLSVAEQTPFIGSCWIIAAQLFALAQSPSGLVVRYHPGTALLKRGENDSFMSQGLIRRLDLAVSGFRRVAQHYFGERSPEARAVSRVLKVETSAWQLLHLRLRLANPAELPAFDDLIRRHFCDGTFSDWLWKRFLLLPPFVLKLLRSGLRTVRRIGGRRQGDPVLADGIPLVPSTTAPARPSPAG